VSSDTLYRVLIWERPEPDERRASIPLSRSQIVAAGIGIADRAGLEAVSIRSVAEALGVRPMRLYSHVDTKDELLELMVDAVHGEMSVPAPHGRPWRDQAIAVARGFREAVLRHPWAVDLLGSRPHLGPNALAVLEATAAALAGAPGLDDPRRLRIALAVVGSYLQGALRGEIGERRAASSGAGSEEEWRRSVGAYLARGLDGLPTIARLLGAPGDDAAREFEEELGVVLAGIAR
jgi:AcrR family transcriptional regulator